MKWPDFPSNDTTLETDIEGEIQNQSTSIAHLFQTPQALNHFSSLTRLKRVIAWCLRWRPLSSPREERLQFSQLQPQELHKAFLSCVFWTQQHYFKQDLQILKQKKELPRKCQLSKLHPFIDAMGILRIGGRLSNSSLPLDQKHPVLLPGDSHLASLVIDWAHRTALHGGFHVTYSLAIKRAWIIRGRVRVKSHLRNCVTCARAKAKRSEQLMGQLPSERVTAARPFMRSGLDYAGPFLLRPTKGRGYRTVKGYIALFVCLSTKAVHLEIVGDLTSKSFLAALRRFIGRRGVPSEIWSDNATTFHGADAELRSLLREAEVNWNLVHDTLANEGVSWKYIPPSAPHFGGLWEAGIKTAKSYLKRVLGSRSLTYEEMSTLAVQIEMCMNSRPLIPISGDPDDLDVLTPGHALVGAPLTQLPEPLDLDHILPSDTHWRLVKMLRDNFWTRWARDYIHTLQQRSKWTQTRYNIRPGNLVMIIDSSLTKRNQWPLGRVIEVYQGQDGLVRAAKIRTDHGIFDRPIHKLCLLPVAIDDCDRSALS